MKRTLISILVTAAAGSILVTSPIAEAAGQKYSNCTQAHADGRYDIPQGDPDYWTGGDRDHDGYACES